MYLPNFIIIGVAKAGTTSLYEYTKEHPEIFMCSIKEPNFFAYDGVDTKTFLGDKPDTFFPIRTMNDYQQLFINAKEYFAIGEASPIYFESKTASQRIHKNVPNVKLIIVLRNPVERAISGYMMAMREGTEHKNISQALNKDSHYVQVGFYFDKLKRYIDLFPRKNIFIGLYDEFLNDNLEFVQKIYQFVGVDPNFIPNTSTKYNVGGYPKSILISYILGYFRKEKFLKKSPETLLKLGRLFMRFNSGLKIEPPKAIKESLKEMFRRDINKVQELINKDLEIWL